MQYMATIYASHDLRCYLLSAFLMQVKSKLKGHSKRITGLAFSHVLNVLVSSGADAQVIFSYLDVCKLVLLFCCCELVIELNLINVLGLIKYV